MDDVIGDYHHAVVGATLHLYHGYREIPATPLWPPAPVVASNMASSARVKQRIKQLAALACNVGRYLTMRELSRTVFAHAPGPDYGVDAELLAVVGCFRTPAAVGPVLLANRRTSARRTISSSPM